MFVRKVYAGVLKSIQSEFITCSGNSNTAYFSKSKRTIPLPVMFLLRKLTASSYIVYHDVVYRQKIGIPMGTNCAPFLANIFLHEYKYEYLSKLMNGIAHMTNAKTSISIYVTSQTSMEMSHGVACMECLCHS